MITDDIVRIARNVELAIFDVDGVLTDGRLILGPDGEEYKAFHSRDGQGLVMLREEIELAVITGRTSTVVENRMQQLGIKFLFQGQKDKLAAFDRLIAELSVDATRVCYVGDDLPDLAVMMKVGLPIAVADADPAIIEHSRWQTTLGGGRGAVREVCDLILSAKDVLDEKIARYQSA